MASFRHYVDGLSTTTGFQNSTGGNVKRDRNGSLIGNLYYNANIVSVPPYGTNSSEFSCNAAFSDSRSVEVLKSNAANYNLSLIRCALSTKDLPVFIPIVAPNPRDVADVNYLNYRVGVQLRTVGSAYRALPDVSTIESNVPMSIGTPLLGGAGWSQPRITFYPDPDSPDMNSPVTLPWNLPITTFRGVLAQKLGTASWKKQMEDGVGSSAYPGTQDTIEVGLVRRPDATSPPSPPGAAPSPGGSAAYLTLTAKALTKYVVISIDFSVHGTYDPSQYARAFGIPVGSVIKIQKTTTAPVAASYVAPLGIVTGPGVFDLTLTGYSNLIWVPEDLSLSPPQIPPTGKGAPPQDYYYWCYSIQTFLDTVVNPAIARALTGPYIPPKTELPYKEVPDVRVQSVETQKGIFMNAIASGPKTWDVATNYLKGEMCYYPAPSDTVDSVAYVAQDDITGGSAPPSTGWATIPASTVPVVKSSSSTEQWSPTTPYACGAGAIYNGTVYIALVDLAASGIAPPLEPLWSAAGQSLLNSWVPKAYTESSYVTYQGNDFYASTVGGLTGTSSPSSVDGQAYWRPIVTSTESDVFLRDIQVDTQVASNPPIFSYDASNLFTLHMDTYSVNGAEDSLGLSGGVPIASKSQFMWPCFESLNLTSDISFAALFAGFEQTTYALSLPTPVVFGGIASVDPSKTVPATQALTDYSTVNPTFLATSGYPALPAYANRLARLGLTQPFPGNTTATLQPNFGASTSFPSFTVPIVQQYESTSSGWCPVDSIVITSADIPLKKELVGNPSYVPLGSPAGSLVQSGNNVAQILTDFSLNMQNANDYRSFTIYIPTGEYRRISLKETGLFQTISFQLWWRNRISQLLVPVTLSPGGSCNLKFLFEPVPA